jgi:plastocyanin
MSMVRSVVLALVGIGLGLAGCTSASQDCSGTTGGVPVVPDGGILVTIHNKTFAPDPVLAHAGSTIVFSNQDGCYHTVTSEAKAGDFVNGAAPGGWTFDLGHVLPGTSATLTVPSTIASGTVQPWFCNNHTSMMANPNPTIHVQ